MSKSTGINEAIYYSIKQWLENPPDKTAEEMIRQSPSEGDFVYNSDTEQFEVFLNNKWHVLTNQPKQ